MRKKMDMIGRRAMRYRGQKYEYNVGGRRVGDWREDKERKGGLKGQKKVGEREHEVAGK